MNAIVEPKADKALEAWVAMNFAERARIMQIVGMEKSVAKTFKKCIAYIKAAA